jgi:hypothetical protein
MRLALRQQLGIAAALALIAAAVVGALLYLNRGDAEAVEFSAASLVPADAPLFFGIDTDLTHPQWVAAFNLARKLGEPDPEGRIRKLVLDEGDLDWEHDVAPFLGGDSALYLRSVDFAADLPSMAFIARCADAAKALAVIEDQTEYDFRIERHEGVEYRVSDRDSLYLAKLDRYLVVATDRDTLTAVIDVHAGRKDSLAANPAFAKLRGDLAADLLAYAYIDTARLTDMFGELLAGLGAVTQTRNGVTGGATAFGVTARKGAFEYRMISPPVSGAAAEALTPRRSRFVAMVPERTSIYFTTRGIDASAIDPLRRLENDASLVPGAGDVLGSLGLPFDFDDALDLLRLATGELAVAAALDATDPADPQADVVVLAEVRDEAAARRALDRVVPAAAGGRPRATSVGNVPMYTVSGPGGELAYAVTAGYMAVGTTDTVRSVLAKDAGSLEKASNYQRTLLEVNASLGTYFYVDLQSLLKAFENELPESARPAARAARSIIFNAVQEGGASRSFGAFVVQE